MKLRNLLQINRQLHKPEYLLNPKQLMRRLNYKNQSRKSVNVQLFQQKHPFTVNENEVIGRSILTMGVYDLIVAEAIERLVCPGDHYVDVGANIGYFSSLAASKGARVDGFEPHPAVFERLQKNLSLPGASVKTWNEALSDKKGFFDLYVPQDFEKNEGVASLEPLPNSRKIEIQTSTFDSRFQGYVDFLKIDVEGHELTVLAGASQALREKRVETIVFEDFDGAQSPVINQLIKYGYFVARLEKKLWGPQLTPLDQSDKIPLWEPPNYIATIKPDRIRQAFKQKGWCFLSRNRN